MIRELILKNFKRPSAYIIILGDTSIASSFGADSGIAAQSILLGAVERGFGGCIIGSIQRKKLRKALFIKNHYDILLVLAIGKPVEKICLEEVAGKKVIRYWRDSKGIHHVPKRLLKDIIC